MFFRLGFNIIRSILLMDAHFRVFLVTERGEGLEPPDNRFAGGRICHSANLASLHTPGFEPELPAYYGLWLEAKNENNGTEVFVFSKALGRQVC
jgi:hypothetical protein